MWNVYVYVHYIHLRSTDLNLVTSVFPDKVIDILNLKYWLQASFRWTMYFFPCPFCLLYSKITHKKKKENPHSTCLYGDHLALRAVAHEVGGNDVRCVVGAALQALNLTGQTHGVAAVNDAITVLGHGSIENCTAVADPGHCDGVGSTFLHCWYIPRSAWDYKRWDTSEQE